LWPPERADVARASEDFSAFAERPGLIPKLWKDLFPRGRADDASRAMLAASRISSEEACYLRCPLGGGGAAAASFWLSVLARGCGGEEAISCAFWSLDPDGALFAVIAREPPIDFWLRLWSPESKDAIGASADGCPSSAALEAAVRSRDGRISALLEHLAHHRGA
jgi:hypothetical protein